MYSGNNFMLPELISLSDWTEKTRRQKFLPADTKFKHRIQEYVNIHCTETTVRKLEETQPWLLSRASATGSGMVCQI
jgi:hypothetical protein